MSLSLFCLMTLCMLVIVFGTRALPFLFAKRLRDSPLAQVLSRSLPLAIMLLLTLHGVEGSAKLNPALLGVGVTALIHLTFKQPIISIFSGTAVYMVLIRFS